MRVRREVISVMGIVLFCLAALPLSAAKQDPYGSPPAAAPVSTQAADGLPFTLWSRSKGRFLIFSDSESFDLPGTTDYFESFIRDFQKTFQKAGFRLHPLPKRLEWIYITQAEHYQAYSLFADGIDLSSLDSYYSTQTNRAAFRWEKASPLQPQVQLAAAETVLPAPPTMENERLLRRIRHELAHQLAFNCGIQKRGVLYPLWVSEGLAMQFESDNERTTLSDPNPDRKQRLMELMLRNELLPLEYLVTVSRLPRDSGQRSDLYAECWAFFSFLFHEYPQAFQRYMAYLYRLEPGYRGPGELMDEFEFHFGDIREYELPWQHFLAGLGEVVCQTEPVQ